MSELEIIAAAKHVLHAWDADDNYEKQDLSDEFWEAMRELRQSVTVVHEVVPQ